MNCEVGALFLNAVGVPSPTEILGLAQRIEIRSEHSRINSRSVVSFHFFACICPVKAAGGVAGLGEAGAGAKVGSVAIACFPEELVVEQNYAISEVPGHQRRDKAFRASRASSPLWRWSI